MDSSGHFNSGYHVERCTHRHHSSSWPMLYSFVVHYHALCEKNKPFSSFHTHHGSIFSEHIRIFLVSTWQAHHGRWRFKVDHGMLFNGLSHKSWPMDDFYRYWIFVDQYSLSFHHNPHGARHRFQFCLALVVN